MSQPAAALQQVPKADARSERAQWMPTADREALVLCDAYAHPLLQARLVRW